MLRVLAGAGAGVAVALVAGVCSGALFGPLLALLLFPFAAIPAPETAASVALALLQFPVYGMTMALFWRRRGHAIAIAGLAAVHALAVVVTFSLTPSQL